MLSECQMNKVCHDAQECQSDLQFGPSPRSRSEDPRLFTHVIESYLKIFLSKFIYILRRYEIHFNKIAQSKEP